MTYYVTALSNDKARLCEKVNRGTCKSTADAVANMWKAEGFLIIRTEEG